MSEAAEAVGDVAARGHSLPTATRQPFDLDAELAGKIKALGLEATVRSLREEGYGYIHDAAGADFNARLREALTIWMTGGSRTKPYEMRVLLGREDFLYNREGAYAGDVEPLMRTFAWSKT